ncbi:MAG TPA: hypothetical protein VNI78_09915 [Vicinamibacterales bacterium]|nr:hypothetical protein [Vicinamibacterales bacterium]
MTTPWKFEVAGEHIPWFEALAFARVREAAAAALVQLTAVDIAMA